MDNWGKMVVGIVIVAIILTALVWVSKQGEMRGICIGKGYDGRKEIDDKWYCVKIKDGIIVGVPFEVVKGE